MKLLIALSLVSTVSFAAQSAKVIFVRGDVTALRPTEKEAVVVKRGDVFPEQTSILTKSKSVVKIKFTDSSSVNLGPNSKIIVSKMPKKEANIVNVLTGVIKSSVNKNSLKDSKTKLIVKTQSAVMGVRGTKFQASYSPVTNRTSLLTVEGEVRMAKVEEFSAKPLVEKKVDKILDSSTKSVEVTPGKVAITEKEIAKPTKPTNIAPEQFDSIAESMDSKVKAVDVMNDAPDDKFASARKDIPKDLIKYKAGGYVDFRTGEYIAPSKLAKLEEETNTYTAPEKKAELLEDGSVKKINEDKEDGPSFWSKYLPDFTRVGFFFAPYSEKLDVKDTTEGNESSFLSKSAHNAGINIELIWNPKITTILSIGGGKYEFDKEDKPFDNHNGGSGDGNFYLDMMLEYNFTKKWAAIASYSARSYRFAFEDTNPGSPQIRTEERELSFLSLGVRKRLDSLKSHNLSWSGYINLIESKDMCMGSQKEEEVKSFGLMTDLEASYKVFGSYYIRPSLWAELVSSEAESKEYLRTRLGAKLLVQKEF